MNTNIDPTTEAAVAAFGEVFNLVYSNSLSMTLEFRDEDAIWQITISGILLVHDLVLQQRNYVRLLEETYESLEHKLGL